MLKKISIALLITLGLTNVGGELKNSYYALEKEVVEKTEFIENGAKLQYQTEVSIEQEIKRIEKDLGKLVIADKKGNYSLSIDSLELDISLWREGELTYVESSIINKRRGISTNRLEKVLKRIVNNKSKNIKHFKFFKTSLKNKDIEEVYSALKNLKGIELLKIEKGYTGKLNIGREDINFGLVNYDTGLEMIIGTPIIFTTY